MKSNERKRELFPYRLAPAMAVPEARWPHRRWSTGKPQPLERQSINRVPLLYPSITHFVDNELIEKNKYKI